MKGFFSFGRDVEHGVPTACYGLSDAQKYLIGALPSRRVVYVTADALTAKRAKESIAALSGKRCALLAAKDEVLTYRRALSKDALFARLNALYEWQTGADVLVCDIEAILQLVPARLPVVTLAAGGETDLSALLRSLVSLGYSREYNVEAKGSFALRGDILDIWPVNLEHPVRIDFFGDEVEAIKPYDEVTAERYPVLDRVDICSATDAFYEEGEKERVVKFMRAEARRAKSSQAAGRMADIISAIETEAQANDFCLPLLSSAVPFFSVLDGETLVIFDECKLISDKLDGLWKEHTERCSQLLEGGEAMNFSLRQYVALEDMEDEIALLPKLALSAFLSDVRFFRPLSVHNFTSAPVRRYLNSFEDLLSDLAVWKRTGYRVMLWCGTAERAEKTKEQLFDNGFSCVPLPKKLYDLKGVSVLEDPLEQGFLVHESKLAVIGTGDLFRKTASARRIKKKRGDLFLAPEVGDYAVHETYGVGKITGTKKIETTDGIKEYVALEYRDGDTLYVPVEQMDILSKYMGEDSPGLSKIGGGEFERVKARVRASLKKMALDLKQLYAERQERRGYVFPAYEEAMEEFEAAFPYEETPDQLSSVAEIKADMCSDKVMDRLLCGDVGFGKTEVALRAAYLCVLDGRQAALMCPSTVLSEQHFRTAEARMKDFGVRIAQPSCARAPF